MKILIRRISWLKISWYCAVSSKHISQVNKKRHYSGEFLIQQDSYIEKKTIATKNINFYLFILVTMLSVYSTVKRPFRHFIRSVRFHFPSVKMSPTKSALDTRLRLSPNLLITSVSDQSPGDKLHLISTQSPEV